MLVSGFTAHPPAVAGGESGRRVRATTRVSVGMLEGQSREIVYAPPFIGGNETLSELTWDLSGLAMLGVGADVDMCGRWLIGVDYHTVLNRGHGEMNDFDWLGPGEEWTDWSRSLAIVEAGETLDARAAARFQTPLAALRYRLILGYRRVYWKWSDRGQEYVYSVDGFRDRQGSFMGARLIDYGQEFSIPYLGCGLTAGTGRVLVDAAAMGSGFVTARDWDYHRLTGVHFEERFSRGRFLRVRVAGSWAIRTDTLLTLALDGQVIPEIMGDMTIVEEQFTVQDLAGISHESVMGTVGVTHVF